MGIREKRKADRDQLPSQYLFNRIFQRLSITLGRMWHGSFTRSKSSWFREDECQDSVQAHGDRTVSRYRRCVCPPAPCVRLQGNVEVIVQGGLDAVHMEDARAKKRRSLRRLEVTAVPRPIRGRFSQPTSWS